MRRALPYILLFAILLLLQLFLFDNLSIGIYVHPLVYVAFIVLLPLDMPPIALLFLGAVTGVSMDFLMGVAGLNTIATLPVAFVRPMLLKLLCKRDDLREGGIPCPARLGNATFLKYLIPLVLLHHALFFGFEALSWAHVLHTLVRIVVSSAVSIVFVWLVARIFTARIPGRV